MSGSAVFSPCGRYRYRLSREWCAGSRCLFVMLNPSTADAEQNDPTIRRCIGYARCWGFGALDVGNIFALRSTDPRMLYNADDPIGPDNDAHVLALALAASRVVVAWGTHGAWRDRGADVLRLLRDAGVAPLCLGRTKDGHPRHPLYLLTDTQPIAVPA